MYILSQILVFVADGFYATSMLTKKQNWVNVVFVFI